ncbi:MAG: RloB domain-containing protein [Magnetococcales bacterium]|nr:hypothetical protein [Magnetococcales bacterium]NGZ28032.1 RloB domain-containing protein [Magnetococcales bacterium]
MSRPPLGSHANPSVNRKQGGRERRFPILIVTEDTKSSLYYLKGMVEYLEKQSDHFPEILFHAARHCDPGGIVDDTLAWAQEGCKPNFTNYKAIFCIFDGDSFLYGGTKASNMKKAINTAQITRIKLNDGQRS